MADKAGGRFGGFASLRQSAQELASKAAASVNEINTKVKDKVTPGEEAKTPASDRQTAAESGTPGTVTNLKADNVDKKELLEVLQKMNKKVKALTLIRQQLTAKVEKAEEGKDRFKSLIVDEILNGMVDFQEEEDEVKQLQMAWRQVDEQNALNLQQLQSEFQTFRLKDQSLGSGKADDELESLKKSHAQELTDLKNGLDTAHNEALRRIEGESVAKIEKLIEELHKAKEENQAAVEAAEKVLVEKHRSILEHQRGEAVKAHGAQLAELEKQKEKEVQVACQETVARMTFELDKACERARESVTVELTNKHKEEVEQLRRTSKGDIASIRATSIETEAMMREKDALQKALEQQRMEMQTIEAQAKQRDVEAADELARTKRNEEQLRAGLLRTQTDLQRLQKAQNDVLKSNEEEIKKLKQSFETVLAKEKNDLSRQIDAALTLCKDATGAKDEALRQIVALRARIEEQGTALAKVEESEKKMISARDVLAKQSSAQIAKLQEELTKTKKVLEEATKKVASAELAQTNTATRLEAVVASKNSELQSLQKTQLQEMAALKAQVESSKATAGLQRDQTVSALEWQVSELTTVLGETRRKIGEAETKSIQQVRTLESEKRQLAHTLEEAQNRVSSAERRAVDMKKELDSQMENASLQAQGNLQDMETTVMNLKSKQAENESLIKSLRDELLQQKSKNTELKDHQEDTRRKYELDLQKVADDYRLRSEEANEVAEVLHQAALEKLQASYEKQLEEAKTKEATIKESFGKVKTAYANKLKGSAEEMQEKIRSLENEKVVLKEAIEAAQKECSDKEESLRKTRAELASTTEEHEKKVDSLQQELQSVTGSMRELQAGRETDMDEKCKKLHSEIQKLKSEHADATQKLLQNSEKQEAKVSELEGTLRAESAVKIAEQVEKVKAIELENSTKKLSEEKELLKKQMEVHVDKITTDFKQQLEAMRGQNSSMRHQLLESCESRDKKIMEFTKQVQSLKQDVSSREKQVSAAMKETAKAKSEHDSMKTELESTRSMMDEAMNASTETASGLKKQQHKLQSENEALRAKVGKIESMLKASSCQVEEQTEKVRGLQQSLQESLGEQKSLRDKVANAAKVEVNLMETEKELGHLRTAYNKLKLDLTKHANVAERLNAEREANERTRGERTAFVGMLENQLSETNEKNADLSAKLEASLYDSREKDDTIRVQVETIARLESSVRDANESKTKATEALATAQKLPDTKATKTIDSLQKELQSVKQQMARKSAAAQRLVQEKAIECDTLRNENHTLQKEVNKGSLSDRKILELAAKQSNRESLQISEIDIRDHTIERMKSKLLERDGELASAETKVEQAEGRVEELCRVRRREDVNLDYLKSTVVKYLSLPAGSSERAGLLPVLATLLQFDESDYKSIEEAKNKLSWWGSVTPTLISAPPPNATGSRSSIGPSVTARHNGAGPTTTSLQF